MFGNVSRCRLRGLSTGYLPLEGNLHPGARAAPSSPPPGTQSVPAARTQRRGVCAPAGGRVVCRAGASPGPSPAQPEPELEISPNPCYQMLPGRVIECLEDEKAALTAVMADRLRDYQELVQVKTGLSLEVATYRALLEGESNPEILIWTKHIETMPQEFRNTSYCYSDSVLQRENERNRFPRQKVPLANLNHGSALHSNLSGHLGSQTTTSMESAGRRGFPGSSPSSVSTTWQENSYEKTISSQTNSRTFSPTYGLSRNTDVSVKTFPDRSKTEGRRDVSTVVQESHRERRDRAVAGASESTRSKERTVILEKKTEVDVTRERERNRPGAIRKKQEEMLFDSKEKASEERNLRWEELTKLDKEARKREMQQMNEKAKGKDALKERHVKGRDIPIHLEGPQARRPAEVTPKGLQMPVKKDADDGSGRQKETREARFKLSPSDPADSLEGDSTTETVAENIVTSILKQFTQTSNTEATANSFPDTKVIYVEKKELPGDKKTKTEIVLESKLTEDVDISDQAGLDYLLSKEAKEVGLKGKSTEQMIGDIINLGLKGRDGRARVVNVEIVEEPMSYVGGEKAGEFSTPFEVEEVDDVSPDPKRFTEEEGSYGETDGTFLGHPRHRTRQENVTHFEEVMEAGDSEGEQSYFVSTPEEHPGGPDRDDDEGSVYGQIHIEEESTIRYSWQDEIVQGSWRRRKQGDHEGEIMNVPEASPADAERTHWTEQSRSGEFHAEPTITEKEIKIPHEFHASIKGVSSKEPRHQLVEVIGQLEQTLPERVKEELSALTREEDSELGGVSVDVKKVQTPGSGSVTLVAEVNLSQTVDADQLDVEQLSRDEASEIEKTVESVVRDNVTRRQGQAPGSPDRDERMESPVSGLGFKRWATRELYSPSGEREDGGRASYSMEQLSPQGPVSATVEVSSPQGFAQSVRHVQLGPTAFWKTEQVSYEGPTVQVAQMDVSNVEATPRWTPGAGTEGEAPSASGWGAWRDAGSTCDPASGTSFQAAAGDRHQAQGEQHTEEATFDKTVQLQRMVDQRSVISDDKKVALLYLDKEEEEDDGHWF
ncbi:synemin [Tupaia chinensis]|uniref:synemin n=1 Tax=Tupaia chinensis TaxID=246437 RepID=UPI000FFC80D6|nr:synemin [Tupaia chinensis]